MRLLSCLRWDGSQLKPSPHTTRDIPSAGMYFLGFALHMHDIVAAASGFQIRDHRRYRVGIVPALYVYFIKGQLAGMRPRETLAISRLETMLRLSLSPPYVPPSGRTISLIVAVRADLYKTLFRATLSPMSTVEARLRCSGTYCLPIVGSPGISLHLGCQLIGNGLESHA